METTYKVKTTHPEKEEYCGEFKVTVHETGSGLTLKYYATGVWGCSRNYDTSRAAIRGLIGASGTEILELLFYPHVPEPVATLTPKEHKALTALVLDGMKVIGADEPKEMLNDNMTWFNRKHLSKLTGFSKHEAAGLMGSLEKKGLVVTDDEDDHEYADFVSDKGINLVQTWFKRDLLDRR